MMSVPLPPPPPFVIVILMFVALIQPMETLKDQIPRFFNQTDRHILDQLVNPSHYDRHIRPHDRMMMLPDGGGSSPPDVSLVNVSVILLTLFSPDESSLKYEVEFLMNQVWNDPRLRFDDLGRHSYLNALPVRELLWIPDTYFILHGEFKHPTEPANMALKIYPNGTVLYTSRRNMIITCEGNLMIFPFDSPKCFFAIESMSQEKDQLELQWYPKHPKSPIVRSGSLRFLNAYLIKNATGTCGSRHSWREEFSCLSVYLVFTRDKSFYFSTVFVPGMVLVTSSFISFWLDVNAVPARVMIGVTTMLNFCTTTNSFRSALPVVSNLTAMNLWDFVCMIFIYASMLEFIIVNYLHRKVHHSRPQSGDHHMELRPSSAAPSAMMPMSVSRTEAASRTEGEEVRAPLVGGEDPAVLRSSLNHRNLPFGRSLSPSLMDREAAAGVPAGAAAGAAEAAAGDSRPPTALDDRARAAASVFAWLRRPNIFQPQREVTSHAKLARSIDHISKTVFPFLYGVFSFTFFAVFAGYLPSLLDEWIVNEFKDE